MTYGVAMRLDRGLRYLPPTREPTPVSNNIASYRKLNFWRQSGDRVLSTADAGNLAVTQVVVSLFERATDRAKFGCDPPLQCAQCSAPPGSLAVREARRVDGPALEATKSGFYASFIFGGQIGTERPRLFQVYSEGNFIEATDDTPFLQIGEHKYGKPILDRVARADMRLGEAAKLMLLSFDSTLRSRICRSVCRSIFSSMSAIAWMYAGKSASARMTSTSAECRKPGRTRCAKPSPRSKNSRSRAEFLGRG